MQKYLDAYTQRVVAEGGSFTSKQSQELLSAIQTVGQFSDLVDNNLSARTLDSATFHREATALMLKDIQKLGPDQVLKMILMFPAGSAQRKAFVERTMELLKRNDYDISKFSFPQLVSYITLVTESEVESATVFQNYLDKALSLRQFSDEELSDHFDAFTNIVHLFALEGCL
jgi:hypothetical protein